MSGITAEKLLEIFPDGAQHSRATKKGSKLHVLEIMDSLFLTQEKCGNHGNGIQL